MRRPGYSSIVIGFASFALGISSCAEPTAPTAASTSPSPLPTQGADAVVSSGPRTPSLLVCPSHIASSAQRTIGLLGGTLSAGGSTIVIPPGAVLLPHTFTVTVPASRLMEVQITAEGYDHFQFLLPVQVTVDYSRCSGNPAALETLSAYYIDDWTKALLALMPGSDDKAARRYTFITDHLSGYAIAN